MDDGPAGPAPDPYESPTRREPAEPKPLGDVLGALVATRGWRRRIEGAEVFTRWREIVGDELARRCEPMKLTGTTLVVRAESTTWATQVSYLASEITRRTDEVVRPGLVTRVSVVVGRLGQQPEKAPDQR